MDDLSETVVIDVRGLKCPLPVLKAERRMQSFASGRRFLIVATDPMAAVDIPHFCNEKGHTLLASAQEGRELRFEIEKG